MPKAGKTTLENDPSSFFLSSALKLRYTGLRPAFVTTKTTSGPRPLFPGRVSTSAIVTAGSPDGCENVTTKRAPTKMQITHLRLIVSDQLILHDSRLNRNPLVMFKTLRSAA